MNNLNYFKMIVNFSRQRIILKLNSRLPSTTTMVGCIDWPLFVFLKCAKIRHLLLLWYAIYRNV